MTGVSNQEVATNASLDLIDNIKNPAPTAPFTSTEAKKLKAIIKVVNIFKQKNTPQKAHHKETSQTRV